MAETESQRAKENYDNYQYARDKGHTDFVKKAEQCKNYYYGDQWDPLDRNRLKVERRPCLTVNKIFPTLSAIQGEQIATKADISFHPRKGGNSETADALTKLYIHFENANKFRWLEDDIFDSGVVTSRGFYDVRMDFSDNILGEVRVTKRNPKNVVIDPDASEYDPDEWNRLFTTKWMSPNGILNNYGNEDAAKALKNQDRSAFDFGYDSMDTLTDSFGGKANSKSVGEYEAAAFSNLRRHIRVIEQQFKVRKLVPHFVDMEAGDMRVIPTEWDNERIDQVMKQYNLGVIDKKVDVLRWVVSADQFILFDEIMPYNHFTIVPYFPYFHEGQTMGLIEHLIGSQDLLNKSLSQELHVINSMANSGWQMEEGQLTNMDPEELEQRGASTGLVLERKKGSAPLEKIQPNQIPSGLDRLTFKADENLKEISMVSDSKRGFDRADVAAKAILAKQQAGSINLAKPLNNLVRTRHIVATRVLDLAQQYYTEERVFNITSKGIDTKTDQLHINQFDPEQGRVVNDLTVGEYDIVITDVPARDTFEETQFSQAIQLKELGVQIPDRVLIENSNLANKSQILDEVDGEPSESEQELAQLEMQIRQLEAQELQAKVLHKKAEAALTMARAQTEALKSDKGNSEELELQQQFELDQLKILQETETQRQKIAGDLTLAREDMEAQLELKRQNAVAERQLKQAEAEERLEMEEKRGKKETEEPTGGSDE